MTSICSPVQICLSVHLSVCLPVQVIPKDGPAERSVANSEVSANEVLCPPVRHRPDLLLRQHSMPTSLHTHSTSSTDVDGYSAYRGLVAGASQGNTTCTVPVEKTCP